VVPNSLVRLDPHTLKPTAVFPIGSAPDTVLSSGGYLWVMHHVLRDTDSDVTRNAGDHTITRVDPSTGEVTVLGGGLAPCGIAADPSGDVWVANCFVTGSERTANVVRIDAESLEFEATWPVPSGDGFFRGLVYGGGSLWVSDIASPSPPAPFKVTQLDPHTGALRSIPIEDFGTALAWSEGYGDLWIDHFVLGSLSRLHPATGAVTTTSKVALNPVSPIVDGDTVWVGDWSIPQLVRIPAVGVGEPRKVSLPTVSAPIDLRSAVWQVDAGAGAVWAATPRLGAVWRIDPRDDTVTRIPMPYPPGGVAADSDAVWVTIRGD
jgi:streptogramin lyase